MEISKINPKYWRFTAVIVVARIPLLIQCYQELLYVKLGVFLGQDLLIIVDVYKNINKTPKRFIEEIHIIEVKVQFWNSLWGYLVCLKWSIFWVFTFQIIGQQNYWNTVIAFESTQEGALSTDEDSCPPGFGASDHLSW